MYGVAEMHAGRPAVRMTIAKATLIALLLYAIGFVPVAWMAWRPVSARWLGPTLGVLIVGLASYQTGIYRADLASTDVAHLVRVDTPQTRCRQVFGLLMQNGILLEQPKPTGLSVRAAAWDQLPQPVREAVVACAQSTLGIDSTQEIAITRR